MYSKLSKGWCIAVIALLASSAAVLSAAQGSRYSLRIENRSMYDIRHLYVASSEDTRWGPDVLGANILASGANFTLTNIRTGEYDVRFVDDDGDECTLKGIKITADAAWKLTTEWLLRCEGYRRHGRHQLSIVNNSRFDIQRVYLSPSNSSNWGRDVLESSLLKFGTRYTVTEIPTGRYDIKFVDEDGDECVLRSFTIATNLSWTLSTDWLLRCEGYARHRAGG